MIPTELQGFLRTRRSIRRFKPESVPKGVISDIIATAAHAPSAHNRQPWRFFVITSQETKSCLASALALDFERDLRADGVSQEAIERQIARSRDRILSAPVVIVLSMDMSGMDTYPDAARSAAERTMAVQSVAAAGTQLLLAAHAEGLGGVWVCSPLFAPRTVKDTLRLPDAWEPQAMYFLGYSDDLPKEKTLRPREEIAIFESPDPEVIS